MTRVVQLSFHADRKGREPEALLAAWPTLTGTAEAAARAGYQVTVVQPATWDAALRRNGVEYRFVVERRGVRRGHGGTRPVRRSAPRLAAVAGEARPDIVHVHGLSLPGHVRRLKRRLDDVPVLGQDHADVPARGRLPGKGPMPWDGVLFTAREQAVPFVAAGALAPDVPVHEVLEASTGFRPGDRAEARRATGIHGDPALLWLGRLDPNKDPLTVLEGFARAAPHLRDPRLWCCFREAPLLGAVRERVGGDPALKGRVRLLGERSHEEVERLLRASDVLVQGSHREGSGYAVVEAMACGVTPVVTDIPSLRRIVGPPGRTFLWPAGDGAALAAALRLLGATHGPALRRAVLRHFDEGLSWDAVGRELAAAYEAALDTTAPGPAASRRRGSAAPAETLP